jgi:hypothetical protein
VPLLNLYQATRETLCLYRTIVLNNQWSLGGLDGLDGVAVAVETWNCPLKDMVFLGGIEAL